MKLAATTIALMLAAMVMFIGCSSYAPVVDVGTMVDIVVMVMAVMVARNKLCVGGIYA